MKLLHCIVFGILLGCTVEIKGYGGVLGVWGKLAAASDRFRGETLDFVSVRNVNCLENFYNGYNIRNSETSLKFNESFKSYRFQTVDEDEGGARIRMLAECEEIENDVTERIRFLEKLPQVPDYLAERPSISNPGALSKEFSFIAAKVRDSFKEIENLVTFQEWYLIYWRIWHLKERANLVAKVLERLERELPKESFEKRFKVLKSGTTQLKESLGKLQKGAAKGVAETVARIVEQKSKPVLGAWDAKYGLLCEPFKRRRSILAEFAMMSPKLKKDKDNEELRQSTQLIGSELRKVSKKIAELGDEASDLRVELEELRLSFDEAISEFPPDAHSALQAKCIFFVEEIHRRIVFVEKRMEEIERIKKGLETIFDPQVICRGNCTGPQLVGIGKEILDEAKQIRSKISLMIRDLKNWKYQMDQSASEHRAAMEGILDKKNAAFEAKLADFDVLVPRHNKLFQYLEADDGESRRELEMQATKLTAHDEQIGHLAQSLQGPDLEQVELSPMECIRQRVEMISAIYDTLPTLNDLMVTKQPETAVRVVVDDIERRLTELKRLAGSMPTDLPPQVAGLAGGVCKSEEALWGHVAQARAGEYLGADDEGESDDEDEE